MNLKVLHVEMQEVRTNIISPGRFPLYCSLEIKVIERLIPGAVKIEEYSHTFLSIQSGKSRTQTAGKTLSKTLLKIFKRLLCQFRCLLGDSYRDELLLDQSRGSCPVMTPDGIILLPEIVISIPDIRR